MATTTRTTTRKTPRNNVDDTLVVDDRVLPDSGLPTEKIEGILDIANEGSGLLRANYTQSDHDVYISSSQIRRFNLRTGDSISGKIRPPKDSERYFALLKVNAINFDPPDNIRLKLSRKMRR